MMKILQPAGCLAADPPWYYRDQGARDGKGRGAANHYPCMKTPDICRMVLPPLGDDCWLFLWRVHTHQQDALDVGNAWGFGAPVSELVWVKQTKDGSRVRMGMGHSLRMAHEVCLVFKRGKPKRASAGIPSVIHAPRLEHSRKPDAFYELVDQFVGSVPRVEMFARRQWKNWRCTGSEVSE